MLSLTSTWICLALGVQRFGEEKLPDRECFYSSLKDETTGDNGEKLHGHIGDEDI